MDTPLNKDDFAAIETQLKLSVEADKQYWRVNGVKCDAITTAKTYEEFEDVNIWFCGRDRVAAAHLRPLDRCDYKRKSKRNWNLCATEEKKPDE